MQAGCVPDFRVFRPVGCGEPPHSEEGMPRCYTTLTLDDAKRMLQAGEAAAASIGIAYNIAIVDAGGNLLWTRDVELARKVARNLYTSGVLINAVTASDPRVPVGGVKNSGYGRELSHFGAHAFVNA